LQYFELRGYLFYIYILNNLSVICATIQAQKSFQSHFSCYSHEFLKIYLNQKKSTRATRDARDKFNVCGKYIFRGKIDNSNVEKVETFKFAFPNIFHDVFLKSYF